MNEKSNIIDLLDEVGMLNLGLAELISAEVLVDIESQRTSGAIQT